MIRKISPLEAECIIAFRKPFGLFYLPDNSVYVGIDNSNGHAWTEEFSSLRECKRWLLDPSMEAPPLEEAS